MATEYMRKMNRINHNYDYYDGIRDEYFENNDLKGIIASSTSQTFRNYLGRAEMGAKNFSNVKSLDSFQLEDFLRRLSASFRSQERLGVELIARFFNNRGEEKENLNVDRIVKLPYDETFVVSLEWTYLDHCLSPLMMVGLRDKSSEEIKALVNVANYDEMPEWRREMLTKTKAEQFYNEIKNNLNNILVGLWQGPNFR